MTNKFLLKTINKLADLSFKDGRLLESQVTKSVKILKTLKTADSIWTISEYLKELKRKERQYTMFIETSFPLPADLLKKIKKIVDKRHKITKIKTSVNPQILGGFKLKIGDDVWDESLAGRINQIKELIGGQIKH